MPTMDAVTRKLAGAWRTRRVGPVGYRGVHRCSCGATSDNHDHYVKTVDGIELETSSLALH